MKIYLEPNTKDINGNLIPLVFFDGCTRLIKENDKSCLIKNGKQEIVVFKEYIRKP